MNLDSRFAFIKTNGDTLNVRSEPNGSIISKLDNGSVAKFLIRPVNVGGRDWIPVMAKNDVDGWVDGWVAAEFTAEATVLYQVWRIIDPSVPESNSVGTTAFKIQLADKTVKKFIELRAPMGLKIDEFSGLSDTELVEEAIKLFNQFWDRFKDNPTS